MLLSRAAHSTSDMENRTLSDDHISIHLSLITGVEAATGSSEHTLIDYRDICVRFYFEYRFNLHLYLGEIVHFF